MKANIQIYNTLSREKEDFQPITPGKVGIYLCGPTVYKEAHIGHMVGPVIFDTIKRYLTYSGYETTWVVNITDVDDKLIAESERRNIPMSAVAEEMTADYLKNLAALGVDTIDQMPKATEYISHIIAFIEDLIQKGFAYQSEGDVYFDVTQDKEYGKLSNRSLENIQGEGGQTADLKRSPGDFALWKAAKSADEPAWESPWGAGRPGWHIECSAMSREILGESFDIHGGGLDLLFPHHENEIAQSECCHGKPMVKYWLHNGLMKAASNSGKVGGKSDRESQQGQATEEQATIDTKISRSKGAGGLADLIERQGGEPLRFFLLRTHYRSTIVFSEEGVEEARTSLETFYRLFERYKRISGKSFFELPTTLLRSEGDFDPAGNELLTEVQKHRDHYLASMDDDFNTTGAVSQLFELCRTLNKFADHQNLENKASRREEDLMVWDQGMQTLKELAAVLGIFQKAPQKSAGQNDELVHHLMDLVIELRASARANKDFATSDKIRDALAAVKITIEDRQEGTTWREA